MLRFYLTRAFAFFVAWTIIPTMWWFSPRSLLPVIEWNGNVVRQAISYLVETVPAPRNDVLRNLLTIIDKVGEVVQWGVYWYVPSEDREHVEVLAKAFFTPGGWLMITELILFISVMIWVRRGIHKRQKLRKRSRALHNEQTL